MDPEGKGDRMITDTLVMAGGLTLLLLFCALAAIRDAVRHQDVTLVIGNVMHEIEGDDTVDVFEGVSD